MTSGTVYLTAFFEDLQSGKGNQAEPENGS